MTMLKVICAITGMEEADLPTTWSPPVLWEPVIMAIRWVIMKV
jgi:hypothetical protein